MSNKQVEIMRGPKLDGSFRPMWFQVQDGKKRRIAEARAMAWISSGHAVEVVWK